MGKKTLVAILLAVILVYGGALRFIGQNWDDFANTHPDELFLTVLVLPQIGGGNSHTNDETHFPSQQILILNDSSEVRSKDDVFNSPNARLGAISSSFSAEVISWLVNEDRSQFFIDYWAAENALRSRLVDALIVTKDQHSTGDNIIIADTINSVQLQSLRCQHIYPQTDGVGGYFDTRCSPLNPHNASHGFYVYGTLPLFLAHFGSEFVKAGTDAGFPLFDFQGGTLTWRGISMIFDILTILVVFALGSRMHNRWIGLLAALFYASAPLAIQKAHFGTVNAVTSFMVTLALYFAIRVQQRGKLGSYLLFGVTCGMAVASRINVAPLAGIIVVAALVQAMPIFDSRLSRQERGTLLLRHSIGLVISGIGAFLAFRILNPYAFIGPGFFDILPNYRWLQNLESISAGVGGLQDIPPLWQWLARSSFVYPLKDMLFWTMGMSFGVMACFALLWSTYRLLRNRKTATMHLVPLVWTIGYFLWMSRLFALVSRYYLPLYGILAVLAGWCLFEFYRFAKAHDRSLPIVSIPLITFGIIFVVIGSYQVTNGAFDGTAITALVLGIMLLLAAILKPLSRYRPLILGIFTVSFSVIWALMHSNIYQHQSTWVQAARYISERVPSDFSMEIEDAEDLTPLINIAIWNSGVSLPGLTDSPYNQATQYHEGQTIQVEFKAPASGTITNIFTPHLFDPHEDAEPEQVIIRIFGEGAETALAEATLSANLTRGSHPLGSAYTIPFDKPLQVQEDASYIFVMEIAPGSGDVIGSGSVVLNEGAWDTPITGIQFCELPNNLTFADNPPSGLRRGRDCNGKRLFNAHINSIDQIMSFPVDNQAKYDHILRTLDLGEYLTIATNRFYDSEPRNPMRWPLTTLYYEKLFAGELGYELVRVFDETFELGPWRVSDQHLPIYDSPAWLNELEADEAFHVYEHPAVFLFRKTEEYSRAKVEAIFNEVSLKQAHELANTDDEAQLLGIFYWNTLEANPVPTALMFNSAEYQVQKEGGTWSERFFSDAIVNTNQVIGMIVWYLVIFIFGAVAFPLVFSLFPNMADGGYGVSKLVGMLLIAWLAWAVSSLKIPIWSQGGVLLSLALVTMLSGVLGYRNRLRLLEFLRQNWKRLAWIEVLAISAFLIMILVRLTNPDLWHPSKGGEKPMDFAYLNGVLRSTTFPPIDPWFAGGFINYYYFGYVLLGAPTLLLGVVPSFAYNLMIPTIFSLTGIGAFSAAFNILSRWRRTRENRGTTKTIGRRLGNPWVAGIMAMVLCVLLGNLDTVRVFGNGLAAMGGYSTPEGLEQFLIAEYAAEHGVEASAEVLANIAWQAGEYHLWDSVRYEINNSVSLVGGMLRGIGRVLGGSGFSIGSDRWYWGPSRVLAETPGIRGGAITEMPYFTFVYGDLHAHMISLPLVLFTVLFLFNELVQVGRERRGIFERACAIALGALTVGLLQATNTWDWPSMTLFAVIGLAYAWWLRWKTSFRPIEDMRFYGAVIASLTVAAILMSFLTSAAAATSPANTLSLADLASILRLLSLAGIGLVMLWVALRYLLVRVSALDLLAQIGGFLFLNLAVALPYSSWYAATYNSVRLWDGGKTPLWAYFDIHGLFLFFIVSILLWDTGYWLRRTRVKSLLENKALLKWVAGGIAIIGLLAVILTLIDYQVALIVLPLVCWIALLFFRSGQTQEMRFVLVLMGLALSMSLGVEIIVIGGDIGRQNTVFKFYMQIWLLLSVAGGIAFACLLGASAQFSKTLKIMWYSPCILLVFIAALFPIMGTRARSFDRMVPDLPLTLNGIDYMTRANYHEGVLVDESQNKRVLSVDHALIRWLQENVSGSPVIMEGRRRPSEYQWNGRIAINTGLPSVLGWNFHQRQQRTFHPMDRWVDQREQNVIQFYNTGDIDIAVDILNHFDVQYIISSGLEALQSTPEGLEKFDRMVERGLLSVAYAVEGGTIFQVNEGTLMQYLVERYS